MPGVWRKAHRVSVSAQLPSKTSESDRKLCHCVKPAWRHYGKELRKIRTSLGCVPFSMRRLRCKNCKTTYAPLRAALGMKKKQRESREFQKLACETLTQQSFRRSCRHLAQIGGMKVTRMLLHRIVVRSDADQLSANIQNKGVKFMIADGTGFPEWKKKQKQKPDDVRQDTQSLPLSLPQSQSQSEIETRNKQVRDKKIKDRKSDLKVVIGLNDKSELVPMGVWAKRSWKTVAKAITKANLDQRIKQRPLVDLLICDGEPSLIEHLNPLAKSVQRCQWHLTYDFFISCVTRRDAM